MKRKTHQIIARVAKHSLVLFVMFLVIAAPYQRVFATLASPVIGQSIYSSGINLYGAIGTGESMWQTTPVEVQLPTGLSAVDVKQTDHNTYILASDNNVYAAGFNHNGELGNGTKSMQTVPQKVLLPGGVTAVSIYTWRYDYTIYADNLFILASDGNVYGSGANVSGVLGDGTTIDRSTPVRFGLPSGVHALEVSLFQEGILVRADDGNAYGAGRNFRGELGQGHTTIVSTPSVFPLPGGVTAKKLIPLTDPYGQIAFVIGSDDQLYGAGENYAGQLGNGNTAVQTTPVRYQLPGGLSVASAKQFTAATTVVTTSGEVYSAGDNGDGEFGDGTTTDALVPTKFQLPIGEVATLIYSDPYNYRLGVVTASGKFFLSGYNADGQLGVGDTIDRTVPAQYVLPGGVTVQQAYIALDETYVLGSDNNLYGAGLNTDGTLGNGTMTSQATPVVFQLPVGEQVVEFDTTTYGYNFSVHVRTSAGHVFTAGLNDQGDFGDGSRTSSDMPVMAILPSNLTAQGLYISRQSDASSNHIVMSNGRLYASGYNKFGQLGVGVAAAYSPTPEKFTMPTGVTPVSVFMLNNAIYGLGSDGQLYGSGINENGQLGVGSFINQFTPGRFQLPPGLTVQKVIFTTSRSVAVIASDGQVYGAGYNTTGILGNGTTIDQSTPVRYQLPAGVTALGMFEEGGIMAGPVFVRGSDGYTYGTGNNSYGQVGIGVTSSSVSTPTPFQVPVGVTILKTVSNFSSSYALGSDGNVYGAGRNNYGQLGIGYVSANQPTPTRFLLPGGVTALDVMSDPENAYVLGSDGNVYGAGRNNYGQLGNATNSVQSTPVRFQLPVGVTVPDFDNAFDYFGYRVAMLGSDGKVYSAGQNQVTSIAGSYGVMGNGAQAAIQSTPVAFQLPVGLSVKKLQWSYNPLSTTVVIASDDQVYMAGANWNGAFGNGTVIGSSSPVKYPLPSGVSAVAAFQESDSMLVLGSDGKLYVSGRNDWGWLGDSQTQNTLVPSVYQLPPGMSVAQFTGMLGYNIAVLTLPVAHAIGGQTFCDANDNGTQDSGESLLDAQSVSLYAAVSGVASGPALATYTSQTYLSDTGVFFFDGLPAGDYILGLTTDTGILYSEAITVNGSGDGWILGNSQFVNTISAMGQVGHVCGASTVITPTIPPATSPPLARTGDSQLRLLLAAGSLICLGASLPILLRNRPALRSSQR